MYVFNCIVYKFDVFIIYIAVEVKKKMFHGLFRYAHTDVTVVHYIKEVVEDIPRGFFRYHAVTLFNIVIYLHVLLYIHAVNT